MVFFVFLHPQPFPRKTVIYIKPTGAAIMEWHKDNFLVTDDKKIIDIDYLCRQVA